MTFGDIIRSVSQTRRLLALSCLAVIVLVAVFVVSPEGIFADAAMSFVVNIISSVVAVLLLYLFFVSPLKETEKITVLSEDLGSQLVKNAECSDQYFIFSRTGRHFRSSIIEKWRGALTSRNSVGRVRVVLLDHRDTELCEQYRSYRAQLSFDKQQWVEKSVQHEVLATIKELSRISRDESHSMEIEIRLSRRLSMFRIEGGEAQLFVTREDPKSHALSIGCRHPDYAAYKREFEWIWNEADPLNIQDGFQDYCLGLQLSDWDKLNIDNRIQSASPYGL